MQDTKKIDLEAVCAMKCQLVNMLNEETFGRIMFDLDDPLKDIELPLSGNDADFLVRVLELFPILFKALQAVWGDWSDSSNANDLDSDGYETLQKVKQALALANPSHETLTPQ